MVVQQEHVTEWDERKVASWLEVSGFGTFVAEFEENGITGDVLVELDRHTLKDLGIMSVGRRVMLLKAIQELREQYGMWTDCGNFTPTADSPVHSEASYSSFMQAISPRQASPVREEYKRTRRAFADQDSQIQKLTQEVERLSTQPHGTSGGEQLASMPRKGSAPVWRESDSVSPSSSSGSWCTKGVNAGARRRCLGNENHDHRRAEKAGNGNTFRPRFQSMPTTSSKASSGGGGGDDDDDGGGAFSAGVRRAVSNRHSSRKGGEPCDRQNFKIRRDDRCFEVLPAVLKNCQVEDDWRNYTLYIAYGTVQRRERLIDHEEKVYPIMCTLKGENPVFVLKRVDAVGHKAVRR